MTRRDLAKLAFLATSANDPKAAECIVRILRPAKPKKKKFNAEEAKAALMRLWEETR